MAPVLACELCGVLFPSKNALFRHLLDESCECGAQCVSKGLKPSPNTGKKVNKVALLLGYQGDSDAAVAHVLQAVTGSPSHADGVTAASSWIARNSRAFAQEREVSAVADVLSFAWDRPLQPLASLNERLATSGVRVHGALHVGADFHAEMMPRRRRYDYLLPAWLLQPTGTGAGAAEAAVAAATAAAAAGQSPAAADAAAGLQLAAVMQAAKPLMRRFYSANEPRGWRVPCHNFCHTTAPCEPLAVRRLLQFKHSDTVVLRGHAYVVLSVTCNGPLSQQVRRMVGLLVACARGLLPPEAIDAALDVNYTESMAAAPAAPAHAVSLAEVGFSPAHTDKFGLCSRQGNGAGAAAPAEQQNGTGHGLPVQAVAGSKPQQQQQRKQQQEQQVVWGADVTADTVRAWRRSLLEAAAERWEAERLGQQWLEGPLQEAVPALRAFVERWRQACARDGAPLPPAPPLPPAEARALPPAPPAYAEVLALLRAADASGLWPANSTGRQTVIANAPPAAAEGEAQEEAAAAPSAAAQAEAARMGGSFSVGAMPATCAVPRGTELFPELTRAAFELERALLPGRPPSSTIAINRHAQFRPHKDSGAGSGQSLSLIVGLGDYCGGELVVEGKEHDVRYAPLEFNGWTQRHWTLPFRGKRYTLVWFTPKGL